MNLSEPWGWQELEVSSSMLTLLWSPRLVHCLCHTAMVARVLVAHFWVAWSGMVAALLQPPSTTLSGQTCLTGPQGDAFSILQTPLGLSNPRKRRLGCPLLLPLLGHSVFMTLSFL